MTPKQLEQLRDQAVENVDRRHGYTMEFAPSPRLHRAEYDEEEERLIYNAQTPLGVTLWVKLENVEDVLSGGGVSNGKVVAALKCDALSRTEGDLESACAYLDLVDRGGSWALHNPSCDPHPNEKGLLVADMIKARARVAGWSPT